MQRYHARVPAPWTLASLARLRELGFTQVQLNLAWGSRPDDETLNLEDVVVPPSDCSPQPATLNCQPGPEAFAHRRALLHERIAMARAAGLRTLFHFGAPYNRHQYYGDTPPNCILDPELHRRYERLLASFIQDFPGVDDILVYTYDQDAWLCGEFGGCSRCNGVPLHRRLPAFIETLRSTWRRLRPDGRIWWEPWELSAGQIHAILPHLSPDGLGLALHGNIAECMAAVVADPWLVNTCRQAADCGLPVWVEWFLGGLSEEVEPFANLAHPLTIWRGLQRIAAVPGVSGLKEYFGLLPERIDDANLAATALFLREPELTGTEALARLSADYGKAAQDVAQAWRLASEAMERHPWDCSWLGREIGRSRTDHALSAAILRPMLCPTPSWQSSRGTVFLRTEDTPAHPWLIEDVGLRAEQAAALGRQAIAAIDRAVSLANPPQRASLAAWRKDLAGFVRRSTAYACHLRLTAIALAARRRLGDGGTLPETLIAETRTMLETTRANHQEECQAMGKPSTWTEPDAAIVDLERNPTSFFQRWLLPGKPECSRGPFSLTSA